MTTLAGQNWKEKLQIFVQSIIFLISQIKLFNMTHAKTCMNVMQYVVQRSAGCDMQISAS
jgi:hypothetical protein